LHSIPLNVTLNIDQWFE